MFYVTNRCNSRCKHCLIWAKRPFEDLSVEAIKNIKIDKVTVWDGGSGNGDKKGNATADFLSGIVKSIPALHDVAAVAGVELPAYLGTVKSSEQTPAVE